MSASNSAQSVKSLESTEPLYQVKLLSALRSGNPALIHPFLTEIGKDKRKSVDGDIDTGAAALHLAVRCASADTVLLLLSHRAISPNGVHPPGSGTTPLHLAASLGRVDIVNILLEQPGIDDTLRDSQSLTCRDVAKGKEVIKAIDDSRSFLNASYRSLLRTYILSPVPTPPTAPLIALLESPRVRFVNLSYLDDSSGRSLLHEAARRKDLRLIELAVRAGADVFVRNIKGKMAYDGLGKDDRVRVFLRQFANQDTTLLETPSFEPPVLKGYLNKYTNVARGYGTRWFVLSNGILSYYRHQEDENVASRGSIAMKTATLKVPASGEKMRFEVQSAPSRGHQSSGVQKWYMKANHPVEASRWTQAIAKSIEYSKRDGALDPAGAEQTRRFSGESDTSAVTKGHTYRTSISTFAARRQDSNFVGDSLSSLVGAGDEGRGSPAMQDTSPEAEEGHVNGDDIRDDSSETESTGKVPPHETTFDLQGNSTAAQMELTAQLLANLSLPANAPPRAQQLHSALKDSFATVQSMINEYVAMSKERDDWWRLKLRRELERQAVWEESLQTVVKEGEALEKELRMRSRKRGSRFFDMSETGGTLRSRSAQYSRQQPSVPEEDAGDYFPSDAASSAQTLISPDLQYATVKTPNSVIVASPSAITPTPRRPMLPSPGMRDYEHDTASMQDEDEEDEFFDAIESGTLPNLDVHELLSSPVHAEMKVSSLYLEPYVGYKNLRDRLPIGSDNRPSTSLWSVLKHSIGKDLTKISFPVFFNEPTSMLQRMAEDMEFSECLDVAVREPDPHRRIAFVAAFAMSNYSSTIGRIAKPFNPMLGETFEYVRFDKEYRYISEQVSHHPPISACWAESPFWNYYGEVDAQNKFMGKSFEIRPTGVAHVDLHLPFEYGPDYPKSTNKIAAAEGKVDEHYSWKKVTTNVSGFILGSPTIDHYGEMTITNHRTDDQCVLTFKPRGWRGKDAFEISGYVRDAQGNVTYEIAGRWNKQLIAKAVGSGYGSLNPDTPIEPVSSPSSPPEYFLLWQNSEKPVAPFNLTPFAITMNDCPETLRPYICPTDCRLRPDQRAFEMGRYELANELKNEQEEKQRATRKAREEGVVGPHKPRWFTAETDGDTGERVWTPSRVDNELEYWRERERVWKEGGGAWKDVDHIFIEPR